MSGTMGGGTAAPTSLLQMLMSGGMAMPSGAGGQPSPSLSPLMMMMQPRQQMGGMNPMGLPPPPAPAQPIQGAGAGMPSISDLIALLKLRQQMQQQAGQGQSGLGQGLGNWMSGYQWNGMPGQNMMDTLSAQAQQNVNNGGPM